MRGRRVSIFVLSLLISSSVFGWDFFGFIYEDIPLGSEYEKTVIVSWVVPVDTYWFVYAFSGASDLGLIGIYVGEDRPSWNPGDEVDLKLAYNGTWESNSDYLPTFRMIE